MKKIMFALLVMLMSVNIVSAREKPICTEVNGVMGWLFNPDPVYDPNFRFREDDECEQKVVICDAIGSRSEGWYAQSTIPMRWVGPTHTLACDSEFGREILNSPNRDSYLCKDGIIYQISADLLTYDNCSGRE